jgi:hypothetical protein
VKSLGATGIPYQYPSPHSHTPYLYPYPSLIPIPLSPTPLLITIHPYPLLITTTPTAHHPLSLITHYLVPLTSYHFRQVLRVSHGYSYPTTLTHITHYSYPLPSFIRSFIHSLLTPPTITYLIHSYPSPHTTHPLALLITTHSFIAPYHSLT